MKKHFQRIRERMKQTKNSAVLFFFLIIFGLILGVIVSLTHSEPVYTASPPAIITYQGKLLQSSASVTTTKTMAFLLFDSLTSGNLLYTASGTLSSTTTVNVTPSNGIFTIQLGGTGTNSLDSSIFQNNAGVYLEVAVEGQALSPRKRITAAPYAFNAQYLIGLSATTTSSSIYIPHSDSNGNFVFAGTPQSSSVGGGIIYINPSATTANRTLFGIGDNGTERFKIDKEGDAWVNGALNVSSTLNVVATSTLATTTITQLSVDSGTFYVDNANNRVGVNTTTPSYDLTVSGQSYFTGTSTIANLTNIEGRVGSPAHKGSIANGSGGALLDYPWDIFVSGNYAYVASYLSNALEIIDISNPASPTHKGSISNGSGGALLSNPVSVFVSGNYAYVTSLMSNSLEIIDITNPANPVHKGSINSGIGAPRAVSVSGNYAYVVSNSTNALYIIDISNPASPTLKGSLSDGSGGALLEQPRSVFISGNYAYVVSATSDALEIIDISNPASPTHKGSISNGSGGALLGDPNSVFISGNYAFIASAVSDALEIIDISNPASPTHKGSISNGSGGALLDGPLSVFISGNYAFIASGVSNALEIIDISNPASPTHKGSISNGSGGALLDSPSGVFISGNYAFIASAVSDALEIIDISGATISQAEIGTTKTTNLQVMSNALFNQGVNIRGGLSIGSSGLLLSGDFGMFSPTSTNITSATNTLSFSHTALFKSSATTTDEAVFIFDTVNTLSSSNLLTIRNNGTNRLTLDQAGNFMVTGTSTLATSTITSLTVTGSSSLATTTITQLNVDSGAFYVDNANNRVGINTTTPGYDLTVSGQSYFTGTSTVTNLFNLEGRVGNPVHKGSIVNGSGGALLDDPNSVFISGNYAYVTANQSDALEIIDISNPASPTHKGSITNGAGGALLDGPFSLYVAGNYAYVVSDFSDALEIIDISDPASPKHKGSITNGAGGALLNGPWAIFVSGNYAYVGERWDNALEIIDISDPANPKHKGSITNGAGGALLGTPYSVFVSGNYAYVASMASNALEIIDISDPASPKHKGSITNGAGGALLNSPRSVFVSGNYAYVASQYSNALEIIDISNPASPTHKGSISNGSGGALLSNPVSVFVSGNYAYVASSDSSALEIIDISNPASPTHKGSISNGSGGAVLIAAQSVFISGNYAFLVASNALEIIDISGATISQAEIGTTKTTNLQVMSNALFNQGVNIRGGLSIGNSGLLLSGDFGMSSPTSTDITSATNTLSFSHTALFKSNATTTEANIFIFDTANTFTASNQYLLSVRQNGNPLFSVATNGDVRASGTLYAASATVGTPGAPGDLAERVDIAVDDMVEPGDVVIVDPNATDTYRRSASAYDTRVSGVISTNPTIVVGDARTNYTAIMAMIGRVPIKVSTENGPIQRGDLLVSASIPGYAMKYNSTRDDGVQIVGVIGMALESLEVGVGKVIGLVRTGWINNRSQTIASLQNDVISIAAASQVTIKTQPQQLTVTENQTGQLVVSGNQNLDINNFLIINVAAIRGSNEKWLIDEDGRFVTKVKTPDGSKSLYALQSENIEYVFSGSSQLANGMKRIEFNTSTRDIVDFAKPLRITITLTAPAIGVYASEKNELGFTVRELTNGTSNATFDWVAIAERRLGITPAQETILDEDQPLSNDSKQSTVVVPDILPTNQFLSDQVGQATGAETTSSSDALEPLGLQENNVEPPVIESLQSLSDTGIQVSENLGIESSEVNSTETLISAPAGQLQDINKPASEAEIL